MSDSYAAPVTMLVSTAISAALSGYMIGIASSYGYIPLPFLPQLSRPSPPSNKRYPNYDDEEESSQEEIEVSTTNLDHAPNWGNGVEADKRDGLRVVGTKAEEKGDSKSQKQVDGGREKWDSSSNREECKMVLVVRMDLGMTKGKIAAQCSHATLACYKTLSKNDPQSPTLRRWERQGQAKVALKVENENELQLLQAKAMSLGLVAEIIADAGRTQIEAGSHTVLGIGPGPKSVIDKVTGQLKLL